MCETATQLASPQEALAAVRAGLAYLAAMPAAERTTAEQADLLRGLAAAEAQHVAASAAVLAAFDRGCGPATDGHGTARSWLRWQARITGRRRRQGDRMGPAAIRPPRHRRRAGAGSLSPSWAREICDWTSQLPDAHVTASDEILLQAAGAGAELADLAALAEEIRARTAAPDTDPRDRFEDRSLRVTPHWRGMARLDGELTPAASAALTAVLETLGKKAGPEDDRTASQRRHDALEEACRCLIAAGGLPDRAGQPTQIQLSMTLHDLMSLPGPRPGRSLWDAAGPPAPPGADCDAAITTLITGHADPEELTRLLAGPAHPGPGAQQGGDQDVDRQDGSGSAQAGIRPGREGPRAGLDTAAMTARAAAQLSIARAVKILSGPGGPASWLRTSQLGGPAANTSLPLDIGATTDTIPPWLRRAIITRDQHCTFPGCFQPPSACHIHHLIPRSEGGTTSLENCRLFCTFHHLIAIHRWGWQITINPDGTTTAVSPDGTKTLHSHPPPVRAA